MYIIGHHSDGDFLRSLEVSGVVSPTDMARVTAARASSGESTCRLLSKLGVLEEEKLATQLSEFLGRPRFNHQVDLPIGPVLPEALSQGFLRSHWLLPLALESNTLKLATADPFDGYALKAMELAVGATLSLVIAEPTAIRRGLDVLFGPEKTEMPDATTHEGLEDDLERLKDAAAEAPVIQMVSELIARAVEIHASDVHLEPTRTDLTVRLRVDGMLRSYQPPHRVSRAAVVSRVKLMAKLDIAERRLPQDGRIKMAVLGKELDLRVSTFPTAYGESVVIRILDKASVVLDLTALGMTSMVKARFDACLERPTGILLVTGPTGSGKTTTLYASLRQLARPDVNVVTIEDPIEYELNGIKQSQVHPQIGLTFASALRSLVRQDPDVLLIGEIRDGETAEIAAQSALTGHKVLSTLHTNDAATSVARLLDLGLAPYLVTATVDTVVAQRLVRVLCPDCKRREAAPSDLQATILKRIGVAISGYFTARGCPTCHDTGYRGRTAIYEILTMTDGIRALVRKGADASEIVGMAKSEGMTTMYQDGLAKVAEGTTTYAEILRAVEAR